MFDRTNSIYQTVYMFVVLLILITISIIMHHKSLSLWWIYDDAYIMELVINENPLSFFVNPEIYRKLSVVNFTPMLILSYTIDYFLFGFNPKYFYIHQHVLIGIISWGIFIIVMKIGRNNFYLGIFSGLFFLMTAPVTMASQILMTRHYLEGGVWAILTIIFICLSEKLGIQTILGGLTYLFACLCKEIYVPLVLAIPFFIDGNWKNRFRKILPVVVGLFLYIPWRLTFLRGFGGYSDKLMPDFSMILIGFNNILKTLWAAPSHNESFLLVSFLIIFSIAIILLYFFQKKALFSLCGVIILLFFSLGAIFPVLIGINPHDFVSYRFSFHLTILLSVGLGYCISILYSGNILLNKWLQKVGILLISLLLIFSYYKKNILLDDIYSKAYQSSMESYFFYNESEKKTLVNPRDSIIIFWALALNNLKKNLRNEESYVTISTLPFVLNHRSESAKYFEYDTLKKIIHDVSNNKIKDIEQFCSKAEYQKHNKVPTIDIEMANGGLSIKNSNNNINDSYFLLVGMKPDNYLISYEMHKEYNVRFCESPNIFFIRIYKKTFDDRHIFSPEWAVSFSGNYKITW